MHGRNGSIHSAPWCQSKSRRTHQHCFTQSVLSVCVLCKCRWVVMNIQSICVCDVEMQYPDTLRNAPSASSLEVSAGFCCSAESPGSLGSARTTTLSISCCRDWTLWPKDFFLCSSLLCCVYRRLYVGKAFPLISVLAGTEQSKPVLNLSFLFPGWVDAVLGEGSVVPWSLSHPWWKPPCFLFFVASGGAGHGCPAAAQTWLPHCPWAEGACQRGKCEIPPHWAPSLASAKSLAQTQINNCREAGRDSDCSFLDASRDNFWRLPAVIWQLLLSVDRCVGFYFFYMMLALCLCLSFSQLLQLAVAQRAGGTALILCVSLLLLKTF